VDALQVVVLALLQGLTEFLPISSSAHLILLPGLLGWPDQGLAFDVAVHVGTLIAVLAYFRADLARMGRDWMASLVRGHTVGDSRLLWGVLLGTLPVGLAGLAVDRYAETALRAPGVIGLATAAFALLLWGADRWGARRRDEHTLRWRDVAAIGCAQALALVPGTSRSGITITAGLALGLTREAAARFAFLLAIPVIVLAGGLKAYEAWTGAVAVSWPALAAGTAIAAASAYLCIHWFLKLVQRWSLVPFVLYRLVLGGAILWQCAAAGSCLS